MMKLVAASLAIVVMSLSPAAVAADAPHWGYSGQEGPEHWGELDPAFSMCSIGKNQSPVNLTATIAGKLPSIRIDYKAGGKEIVNNGHTIQVNYTQGSTITVAGHVFELRQFHFHAPSENTIEGRSYPMEGHFVHADKDGNLAVVAVMFKEGKANAELEKAWAQMPEHAGESRALVPPVNAKALLPRGLGYYRYNGSLTTPPCSEGVWWLVLRSADTASAEQVEKFAHTIHHPNNRPVQPINARPIVR
jgi:carbonic anhydrase